MSLFGASQAELQKAYDMGYADAEEHKKDAVNHVWRMWCASNLHRGQRPPLFCPDEVILAVRREHRLKKAGL